MFAACYLMFHMSEFRFEEFGVFGAIDVGFDTDNLVSLVHKFNDLAVDVLSDDEVIAIGDSVSDRFEKLGVSDFRSDIDMYKSFVKAVELALPNGGILAYVDGFRGSRPIEVKEKSDVDKLTFSFSLMVNTALHWLGMDVELKKPETMNKFVVFMERYFALRG
jgi:hypothetical protein